MPITASESVATMGLSPWWAHQDLNLEPTDYESAALTVELWAPYATNVVML
jgi:hypothetical protein